MISCNSFPRRNLFKTSGSQGSSSKRDSDNRDRSRSPAVRFRDGKNTTGLEGFVTFGSSDCELDPSSPTAVVSSSPAPVSSTPILSWADMADQDEDALWDIISNQPFGENVAKENKDSGTQAQGLIPEDDEEDTLVATPQKMARTLKRKISVQELLQSDVDSPIPPSHVSHPVSDAFKTPSTSEAKKNPRNDKHRHHHREQREGRQHRSSSARQSSSKPISSRTIQPTELESNPDVLKRRQKDVDFGKNTIGYQNYVQFVPRVNRTKVDPQTPDKFIKFSRRSWDQQVKIWRQKLHAYDPNDGENDLEMEISEIMSDLSFSSQITPSTGDRKSVV